MPTSRLLLLLAVLALSPGCSLFPDPVVPPPPPIDDPPVDLSVGCPDTTYPSWATSPYVLPYRVGEQYRVNLSHCSGSYHSEGRPDAFAIDFAMPIGTMITASRAGTVVHVEERGEDGHHPNNLVVIDHGDGTFAEYMHLTQDGALVDVGDAVVQGTEIGLSGNTGLAGYPHLHLVMVEGSYAYPYTSMPVTFSNTTPNPRSLESGVSYTAESY